MRTNAWIALAIVLLTQTGVLGWMVYDRQRILRSGKEITLKTEPIDPRSLFRGDYVILNYVFSRVPHKPDANTKNGDALYVTLEEQQPGDWRAVTTTTVYPAVVAPNQVVLRGKVINTWPGVASDTSDVRFGIESYFVPEGEGKVLEDKVRTGDLKVVVAVDESGKAAIKGLVLDGNVRYDEPLF